MNRRTAAGDVNVKLLKLLCATFELSRAADHAEARRQRGNELGDADGKAVKPRRPSHTSAEVVLLRIWEVIARETSTAW